MDFRFTPQQEAFRKEIRDFLKNELPPGWVEREVDLDDDDGGKDKFAQQMAKKMGQKGWITGAWPKKYGGLGWTTLEQVIFTEEMTLHKVPRPYITDAGVSNVGPTLAIYASEEQKAKWLPGIAKGEDRWCQLFSEPNAGSDLANIETTALEDGDDYVVNGTKIWTSQAHKSKWGAMMAKTDLKAPKHKSISYIIVDMKSPGITFRPLINICDVYSFNIVHLDNVRVPKSNLIGEKNRGWYSGATTLNLERSFVRHAIIGRQYLDEVMAFVKTKPGGIDYIARNTTLRNKIAEMYIELHAGRWIAYRVAWLQSKGAPPSYESSVSKLFNGEMTQRLVGLVMEILGLYSQIKEHSKHAILRGKAQQLYLAQRAITIGGGTSEIQRGLIARRGLGLAQGA